MSGTGPILHLVIPGRDGTKYPAAQKINKTADPARNAVVGAALLAARTAWERGQDVETALQVAGYARYVIDGVVNYITETPQDEVEATTTQLNISPKRPAAGEMSSSMSVKRARRGSKGGGGKKKVPVAKSVKTYVKKCMDRVLEPKYTTLQLTQSNITSAGVVLATPLGFITQGTTDASRTGNMIHVKRIRVLGHFGDSTASPSTVNRFIILWDRQPNGAAPAFGEIIATNDVNGPYNSDTVVGWGGDRFTIIHDTRTTIWQESTGGNLPLVQYTGKQNKVVKYDTNTGAVADLVTNNLVLVWCSSGSTADFAGYLTVEFVDN